MANSYGYMADGSMTGGSMGSGHMIGPMMPPPPPPPDPSTNNQPLQFNRNKGKPPMPKPSPQSGEYHGYDDNNQLDMDLEANRDEDLRNGRMMRGGGMRQDGMMGQRDHMIGPGMGQQMGGTEMMGQWGPMMGGHMMGQQGMNTMMGRMEGHPDMMGQGHPDMMGQGHPDMMGQGHPDMMGQGHPDMMGQGHPDMMDQPMMMGEWGHMGGQGMGGAVMQAMMIPLPPGVDIMQVMGGIVDPSVPRVPITLDNNTTLYPPPPSAPLPNMRDRPPGCKTIFVGGLPENTTEELLREIFEKNGPMTSVRLSKKNFAHIRFDQENSVEMSLLLSGYRLKIENSEEKANTGRLHVDYAQARDDLYEWECNQRAYAREARHRQRLEQERLRPPSPPPVIHYSDHEAQILLEKVKDEESFAGAAEVLITWMDRGDVNRRTSNIFYSMVQSVNAHVKRLQSEKSGVQQEFEEFKMNFMVKLEGILRQIGQVEKVFLAVIKQKAWDHFSKAQRKNMDMWRKICVDIREKDEAEFFKERKEDEMEMSDEEGTEPKRKKTDPDSELKDENRDMKFQIEAYKNEVMLLKAEAKELGAEDKDKQLKMYQQTLQGMQQQLLRARTDMKDREKELQKKVEDAQHEKERLQRVLERERERRRQEKKEPSQDTEAGTEDGSKDVVTLDDSDDEKDKDAVTAATEVTSSYSSSPFSDREARLVGLISTFLHVHPFGASVDYIWSYLQRIDIKIRTSEIEDLLEKCSSVFRQVVTGIGANIEKRWKFIAFDRPGDRDFI